MVKIKKKQENCRQTKVRKFIANTSVMDMNEPNNLMVENGPNI